MVNIFELSTLKIKADGIRGQVVKDGVDISKKISAININICAGKMPVATITYTIQNVDISADVVLKEHPTEKEYRRIEVITENKNQLRAAEELMSALKLNVFELALLTSSLRVRPEFDLEYLERHYPSNRVSL